MNENISVKFEPYTCDMNDIFNPVRQCLQTTMDENKGNPRLLFDLLEFLVDTSEFIAINFVELSFEDEKDIMKFHSKNEDFLKNLILKTRFDLMENMTLFKGVCSLLIK